jgi:hypothetical protein
MKEQPGIGVTGPPEAYTKRSFAFLRLCVENHSVSAMYRNEKGGMYKKIDAGRYY